MRVFLLLLSLSCVSCASSKESTQSAANMLIIGDSISIGYTPALSAVLEQHGLYAEHNTGNAQTSRNGLKHIDSWLAQNGATKWKLVTFNHGLWDINRLQVSREEYVQNLRIIALKVQAKSEKCIFITSTFTVDGRSARLTADTVAYNEAAIELMNELQIPVIELYEFSSQLSAQITDDAHFTPEGYDALGLYVGWKILEL